MASTILEDYINWGIIGPDQFTDVNDIDWGDAYKNFQTARPLASSVVIPDTCQHCKNPNTRKTRLCEWCGSQIA